MSASPGQAELRVGGRLPGGVQGGRGVSGAVAQHGPGEPGTARAGCPRRGPRRRRRRPRYAATPRFGLAVGGQGERRRRRQRHAGGRREGLTLLEEVRRVGEPAHEQQRAGVEGERRGQQRQRAGRSGVADRLPAEPVGGAGLEHLVRRGRGQPQQVQVPGRVDRVERPSQGRHRRGRPVQRPRHQAGEQATRGVVPARHAPRRLGRPVQVAGAETTGVHPRAERRQVGLPRRGRVQFLEPAGRGEQRGTGRAARVEHEGGLCAEPLRTGLLQRIQRPELRGGQQVGHERGGAGVEAGPRRAQQHGRHGASGRGQLGGAFEERRGRRPAAAGQRPVRRPFQLARRPPRPASAAACARCQARRSGSRSGSVTSARARCTSRSVGRVGGPPGGRADQRVPEPHPGADLDQPATPPRRRGVHADAEPLQRHATAAARHRPARRRRRAAADGCPPAAPRSAAGSPPRPGSASGVALCAPNPNASSAGRQPARQLEQRQRVAAGLGDDPVPDPGVDRPGQHRVQQRPRVRLGQALDPQLRQAAEELLVAGAARARRPARPTPRRAGGRRT